MIRKDSVKIRGYIKQVTVIIVTGDTVLKLKTHIYRKYSYFITGKFTRKIASL
jgi:hypothetical protein